MPNSEPVRGQTGPAEDSAAGGTTRSIGQVLACCRPDFPEISISKIRFLESRGADHPAAGAVGLPALHRRDVERLRYVLSCSASTTFR